MDGLWLLQYELPPALASALLNSLWQDTLLGLLAAIVLHALASRSAATRHVLAMGFLWAMLAVPAMSVLHFWRLPATELNAGLLPAMTATLAAPRAFVQHSDRAALWVSLLWLLGASIMLLRYFGGWRLVDALERQAYTALPEDWQQRVSRLQQRMGVARAVTVRLAGDIVSPFTARLWRPVIWLPARLLSRLPIAQLEALIAHELAHIRRLDWLWNGLQCVIESLLFFHPAAWWLGRRIRIEREHACDDLAVAACGNPIDLAEALEALARQSRFPRLVLAAQGGSVMQRITRLLTGSTPRSAWWLPAIGAAAVLSGTLLASTNGTAQWLPSLHVESTTAGVLGPGDSRQITENDLGGSRFYRIDIARDGRRTEVYRKDGKAQPITAEVRQWIDKLSQITLPARPPVPPVPPAPPLPPGMVDRTPPPSPLAPPAPPLLSESQAFQSILRLVSVDVSVVQSLSTPLSVSPETVTGNLEINGPNNSDGAAHLKFVLSGPKGHAIAKADATETRNAWTLDGVALDPLP